MTDGILLAELQRDRLLCAPTTRSSSTRPTSAASTSTSSSATSSSCCRGGPTSRSIITSATIDTERFAEHFAGRRPGADHRGVGPHLPGRDALPALIDERRRRRGRRVRRSATRPRRSSTRSPSWSAKARATSWCSCRGEREIRDTADALAGVVPPRHRRSLPLFARLSSAEQHRVFDGHTEAPHRARHQRRRDLADRPRASATSSTPASARISRYSARSKVQRLPIEPISQASAGQRSGRCGRVAPGICDPALRRGGLRVRVRSSPTPRSCAPTWRRCILQMTALGLGDVGRLPLRRPARPAPGDGRRQLLEELGRPRPTPATG